MQRSIALGIVLAAFAPAPALADITLYSCDCTAYFPGCQKFPYGDCAVECRRVCESPEQRRAREQREAQEREQARLRAEQEREQARLRAEQHKQQLLEHFRQARAQPATPPPPPEIAQQKNRCLGGDQAACQQLRAAPKPAPAAPPSPAPAPPAPPAHDCMKELLACDAERSACARHCGPDADACFQRCHAEAGRCKEPNAFSQVCTKQFKACYDQCAATRDACPKQCRDCGELHRTCGKGIGVK